MQTLRSYLESRPKAEFAEKVGITPPYLSQLLAGNRQPSLSLMRRILEETGGAVTLDSWATVQRNVPSHGDSSPARKGAVV